MGKKANEVFDEALRPFLGAKWAACKLDFSHFQESGKYNYALLIYRPYDELMTLDDYDESRQFAMRNRNRETMGMLTEAVKDACAREQIPIHFPKISIDHMSPPYITALSSKHIGVQAGVGWIGKNDLLITREYGPRIFTQTAVFYADELELGEPTTKSECGDCALCVDACPYNNIYGVTWDPGKTRDDLVNYHMCSVVRYKVAEQKGLPRKWMCAKCVLACPRGMETIEEIAKEKENYYEQERIIKETYGSRIDSGNDAIYSGVRKQPQ